MVRDKVMTYLGFAAKSRNLVAGSNTCQMMMEKWKIQLLIVTDDIAENTMKKMLQCCNRNNIEYRVFGNSDELSRITGKSGKGIFGITDKHFAEIIVKEIDQIQSEREVF